MIHAASSLYVSFICLLHFGHFLFIRGYFTIPGIVGRSWRLERSCQPYCIMGIGVVLFRKFHKWDVK